MNVDAAFTWIWKSKCTMQWKVFLWLLLADRLNTRNMLRRRHYRITDDDYSFLLCNIMIHLRNAYCISSFATIQCLMPEHAWDLLASV